MGGGESQGRCERRSGVFLKIQRKTIYTCIFFGGVGGRVRGDGVVRVAVNGEVKFFVKIKKKLGGGGGCLDWGGGGGGGVRVDVNEELKFL